MTDVYGSTLKFVVFDILLRESYKDSGRYLNVPEAELVAKQLNLEFVDYIKGPNIIEWIEIQTQKESVQAIRNGKIREGIVIRPIKETIIDGKRVIMKHKRKEFLDTATMRPLGQK